MKKIIPVDSSNIDEAINLLNKVFPKDVAKYNNPEIALRCSLDPKKYKEYYEHWGLIKTTPYVLVKNGKIIGTTGIYYLKSEPSTAWLGWYCIVPEERGKGLGKELLEWTMNRARERGFKTLKLYTSNDPELEVSQVLYEKLGFKEIGRGLGEGEELIYKVVEL